MTGTEWYMTKKGLDVLKLVCTKSNVQWMMRLYNKHLVKPAEHFAEYKKLAQDDYGIVSNSVLGRFMCHSISWTSVTILNIS